MLSRRTFLGAVLSALPSLARAQERRLPRIGVLWHAGSAEEEGKYFAALGQGFKAVGLEPGRTVLIEHRFPAEDKERFTSLAEELVALDVDVLVAVSVQAAVAAKRATRSIPIVFVVVPDPVAAGLVTSLAAPGGNITGFTNIATDLTAKRLQLFKEALGDLSRVALLVNPDDPVTTKISIADLDAAGRALDVAVVPFEVRSRAELAPTLAQVAASGVGGFVVAQNPVLFNERQHIAELAIEHRLPSIHINGDAVDAGFLMSYGADHAAIFRRAPTYADRILKGAKPGQLPVEQPTTFELVVNLRTAERLGRSIPSTVLARADRVVES